ncbi:hypothetical protein OY671_010621, partial [Metschnikowia pulcherrima]
DRGARGAVAQCVAFPDAAAHRAAAGHAGHPVGQPDRVRAVGQFVRDSRAAGRTPPEDGGHGGLRRIPDRIESAAGRGHRHRAAGGQRHHHDGVQPRGGTDHAEERSFRIGLQCPGGDVRAGAAGHRVPGGVHARVDADGADHAVLAASVPRGVRASQFHAG